MKEPINTKCQCPFCRGDIIDCPECFGAGMRFVPNRGPTHPDLMFLYVACNVCDGKGYVPVN